MRHIFLNLKRFDIEKSKGGVNDISSQESWANCILDDIAKRTDEFDDVDFCVFVPEGHLLLSKGFVSEKLDIGCQGVFRRDVEIGGNFGAFTTFLTAKAAKGLGATYALIGHSEERASLREIIQSGGGTQFDCINEILNSEVKCAISAGLKVLFCIGERIEEQDNRFEVLRNQLEQGLKDIDCENVVVGYEPVWAIGPNRPVPTKEYIEEIADFVKSVKNVEVVYGGGLKVENADMIAQGKLLDGGLIGLTSFGADFGFNTDGFFDIVEKYCSALKRV